VVSDNLLAIDKLLADNNEAHELDLLLLPENFACMATTQSQYLDIAEHDSGGEIQSWLSELAKRYSTWLVAGSLPIKSETETDRVYTSCLVFSPTGERVMRYDKIHLFDVSIDRTSQSSNEAKESYRESSIFIHGDVNQQTHFNTPWGDVAVSICYDLRFPEHYRNQPDSVILHCVPAAFTKFTGELHWQPLLQARAIENQSIVLASGQVGLHDNNRETWGHSMIIDAWGTIQNQQKDELGLVSAAISLNKINDFRQKFPCLSHKRTYH